MLQVTVVLAMASFCRSDVFLSSPELSRRVPAVEETTLVNRTHSDDSAHVTRRLHSRDKVTGSSVFGSQRVRLLGIFAMVLSTVSVLIFMFQPGQAFSSNRLPPRWDPNMEGALPFRTWMQDVMLWTICTDMQPPQQCAAIISQLGGQARELARTLSPAEVFGGGVINGVQLDPVSFLMHGLSTRFGPLDEENRLQAAQALLTFARRQGETIDTLISRFEITRARAATEGGGALSVETSALTLLRACGVSSDQFQALTQPFGLRLPNNEAEFNAMCHHLRRMGHIVERFPNNIASGLRSSSSTAHFSEAFMSEPASQTSAEPWGVSTEASSSGVWPPQGDRTDWAFAAVSAAGDGASDTDSATSSDHDEPLPVEDLQGLSTGEVDEYLFGQYQAAKKRWRRYSGKPVRALRRVIRRKGKGKGKQRSSYLNIDSLLQQSAYFKGKGKGGTGTGKGFGRKGNPRGRDGEPLKCSICGSAFHLRARCPRRDSSTSGPSAGAPSGQPPRTGPSYTVEPAGSSAGLHFATFESDSSWANIMTPRSQASTQNASAHTVPVQAAAEPAPADAMPSAPPSVEVHNLSPDPWTVDPDPWAQWLHDQGPAEQLQPSQPPSQSMPASLAAPRISDQQALQTRQSEWVMPSLGRVGPRTSFGEMLGFSSGVASQLPPASAAWPTPGWFNQHQSMLQQVREGVVAQTATPTGTSAGGSTAQPSDLSALPALIQRNANAPLGAALVSRDTASAAIQPVASSTQQTAAAAAPGSTALSMFGQVHALRQTRERRDSDPVVPAANPRPQVSPPRRQSFHGHATSCTICMEEYQPRDHICRLQCGHTYHCVCVGELALHSVAELDAGTLQVECPLCRSIVSTVHSWRFPDLRVPAERSQSSRAAAQDPTMSDDEDVPDAAAADAETSSAYMHQAEPLDAPTTPSQRPGLDDDEDADVFMSPNAYPWWPVPSHQKATHAAAEPETAYHSNVRLADGRVGLLVDPGSYGNLVGEQWLKQATARTSKPAVLQHRAQPLQVGGVGHGAQTCGQDCKLPIAMRRDDGSIATGSFTSPVVRGSACPALLGLRTLAQNGALLDTGRKQLHFLPQGTEATIVLPPGAETFQLESAQSGHLLLPCGEFGALKGGEVVGEHHLFADNERPTGQQHQVSPRPSAESSWHVSHHQRLAFAEVDKQCAEVLASFTYDAAAAVLKRNHALLCSSAAAPARERFQASGMSQCFGAYTHGGMTGITDASKMFPNLCTMLCRMISTTAPGREFSAVMLICDVQSPVHIDRFNQGENILLPITVPRSGGNLWLELGPGDTVCSEPVLLKDEGVLRVGHHIALSPGTPVFFSPIRHATQPWSSGPRAVLAAFTPSTVYKLDQSKLSELVQLGFSPPGFGSSEIALQAEPEIALPAEHQVPEVGCSQAGVTDDSSARDQTPMSDNQQPQVSLPSAESSLATSTAAMPVTSHNKQDSSAKPGVRSQNRGASRCSPLQFVKRVLLVTLFHSTVSAFRDAGWEPMKLRPLELLRDGFDDALYRLKQSEFSMVWVDLSDPRQFAGQERTPQVCNRLQVLRTWAERQSVPMFFAAVRRTVWQHEAFKQLVQGPLHVSHHRWCRANAKISPDTIASAVRHKVLSTVKLPCHECKCRPDIEHTFDLDSLKGEGSAKVRATAEHQVMMMLMPALDQLVQFSSGPESTKPSDPLCSFCCQVCGLTQVLPRGNASSFCAFCQEPCTVKPARQQAVRFQGPLSEGTTTPASSFAEPSKPTTSYPTEQKLMRRQREQEMLKQGRPLQVRKKKKTVEQHFDDCGEDLSSLKLPVREYLTLDVPDCEDEAAELVYHLVSQQMNAFTTWGAASSSSSTCPDASPCTVYAVDVDEMLSLLASPAYASWGAEVVELYGGSGPSGQLCVRRKLSTGQCLDLVASASFSDAGTQGKFLSYLSHAQPLLVILAPKNSVGTTSTSNTYVSVGSHRSVALAEATALSRFTGEVARHQAQSNRFFLCEQPYPSRLYQVEPWPVLRARADCYRVVLDQCMLGPQADGQLLKKPTELVSNAVQILQSFANVRCDAAHVHARTHCASSRDSQPWPYEMRKRVAQGIEKLTEATLVQGPEYFSSSLVAETSVAYPSVGSGPGDEGTVEVPEEWRKCKGCLWRLEKYNPLHSRIRGQCKHPDVESIVFDCPACRKNKTRADPGHTFGPDCRHVLSQPRKSSANRRPYGRLPAREEPTAGLRGSDLGRAEEQAAEDAIPPSGAAAGRASAPSSSSHEPCPIAAAERRAGTADHDASGTNAPEPSAASGAHAPARGRGPDIEPRNRRTWAEGEAQTPIPSDWSSFDVQSCFRALRNSDPSGQRRLLRKLHLRWWHASADKMQRLLRAAGIPKEVSDLVPDIVDTCRVCRHWARPSPDAKASCRMVVGFNIEVEGDLMFYRHQGKQHIIVVLVDRGVRWTATALASNKQTDTLLTCIDQMWLAIFGPMQVLVWDGETGLDDEESTTFCQLKGITKRTAAPNQHTRIADRKIAVLRDTLHKLSSQLAEEGLTIPFTRMVSEATFALNALTSVNGQSPYAAVLGRVPALLPGEENIMPDDIPGPCSQHSHRLREMAVQAIAEGTARERMRRAMNSQTRPAGIEHEFKVGDAVDYWREPLGKDTSGWRGPATVADLTRLEHGRVGIRTSTDQVLTCRLQDLRHSLSLWSEELSVFFGAVDHIAPAGSQASNAQSLAQQFVDAMRPGVVLTLGTIKTSEGEWIETPQTQAHRVICQACIYIAETVFHLNHVAAVRLASGVRTLTSRDEFVSVVTLWWTAAGSRQLEFLHSDSSKLSWVDVLGQRWKEVRMIQFLCVADTEDWIAVRRWVVPSGETAAASEPSATATADVGDDGSVDQRLSTIPEESLSSSDSLITWSHLCEMFGQGIAADDVPWLVEAYESCSSEICPGSPNPVSIDASKDLASFDMHPAWSQAPMPESLEHLSEHAFEQAAAQCDSTPDGFSALDADDVGAYVALEIHGSSWKCIEGVSHAPAAGEHVELRCYESHTRKAVIDRNDDILTQSEIAQHAQEITQAVIDELKTWQSFKCFERRPRTGAKCIIDTRWVYKWKVIKGQRKIRARLCLRGFKETGADDQSNYAATGTRLSQRILVSECVLRDWVIASSDVPKAFLQGVSYSELATATRKPERDVNFELAGEGLRCLRLLPEFSDFCARTEVLHCLKPGTGCRDAPKCFSLKLREVTSSYGFVCSTVDPELELLFVNGVLTLAIVKHVDDLKMMGQRKDIEKFVAHVAATFGKMDIDWKDFTFCGIRHYQAEDGSISLDQIKFLTACKPMSIPAVLAGPAEEPLSESNRRHFLSLLMTIAYSLQTRPDIAVFVTALQREAHQAKSIHARRLNMLLKWIQANPRKLVNPRLDCYPDALIQISDSSFKAKADDGLSVRGLISVRTSQSAIVKGAKHVRGHLIDFLSKAQRHVTRSTFSSELFAATDAVDSGLLCTIILQELATGVLSPHDAKCMIEGQADCDVKLSLVLDARSVTSAVVAPYVKVPAEPSLLLHVHWLRSLLQSGRLSKLFWCDTRSMTADGMTKGSVARDLIDAVMKGELRIDQPFVDQVIS